MFENGVKNIKHNIPFKALYYTLLLEKVKRYWFMTLKKVNKISHQAVVLRSFEYKEEIVTTRINKMQSYFVRRDEPEVETKNILFHWYIKQFGNKSHSDKLEPFNKDILTFTMKLLDF